MGKKRKKGKKEDPHGLRVIRVNVGGADLGSTHHVVCIPTGKERKLKVRTFGTTTPRLLELVDWLESEGIESVAMESTYIYWIPLYETLVKAGIEAVLVNAAHVKSVPGRKSDPSDARWLQLLHSVGLLKGSFRPDAGICQVRALTRQCANLVELRTKAVQWMQKSLDQMNIQVHRAVTDMTGVTGLSIIRAIVAGERDPMVLAGMRDKRCRKSEAEIAEHLQGTWLDEHLFNLAMALEDFDHYQKQITRYEEEISRVFEAITPEDRKDCSVAPHPKPAKQKAINRHGEEALRDRLWRFSGIDLTTIDGIGAKAAQVILSEVGIDLSAFPSEGNFVSWLRLCRPNNTSAGKRLKKLNGTGSSRLAAIFRMSALSLCRAHCSLGAEYRRHARRKSGKSAVFIVARKLATLVYRMLRYGQDYVDVGVAAYERRFRQRRLKGLLSAAKQMGYELTPLKSTG